MTLGDAWGRLGTFGDAWRHMGRRRCKTGHRNGLILKSQNASRPKGTKKSGRRKTTERYATQVTHRGSTQADRTTHLLRCTLYDGRTPYLPEHLHRRSLEDDVLISQHRWEMRQAELGSWAMPSCSLRGSKTMCSLRTPTESRRQCSVPMECRKPKVEWLHNNEPWLPF